jgi:hypothetical protein
MTIKLEDRLSVGNVTVYLKRRHSKLVNYEIKRMKQEYGVTLTQNEFILLLIEMHETKIKAVAQDLPNSISWLYHVGYDD